ncbi:MAG: hypothetical protein HY360_27065 [Verrucomicrobia bacterium]|nr:hypothetical protein [Verrucomicrobiota bacterium]
MKKTVCGLIWVVMAAHVFSADSAWLSIRRSAPSDPPIRQKDYLDPDGGNFSLMLTANRLPHSDGAEVELPVNAREVEWAVLVSNDAARNLAGGVILQGVEKTGIFCVSEVIPSASPPTHVAAQDDPPATAAAKPAGRLPARSAWRWQPELWKKSPALFLERLQKHAVKTVYVTIPVQMETGIVSDPQAVQDFIDMASAQGIRVWAVDGDPRAVLPSERPKFVRRAQAYAAYNREAKPSQRISGIQCDIEPYILAGYELDHKGWNSAYVKTISALKAGVPDMPLEAALPFWFAQEKTREDRLLEDLAGCVDGVVVMDYRTGPEEIRQFARPFLEWGQRRDCKVKIGLEGGPLGDEQRRHYQPAATGDLWLLPLGQYHAMVQLKHRLSNPRAKVFAHSNDSMFRASVLTFHDNPEKMRALLPSLEEFFQSWPCFDGMALHGLD